MLGLRGVPAAAEEVDALRDCALAELSGARVHLAHLSTRGAIEAVRRAKEKGLFVSCEVSPHHWTLSDEAVAGERAEGAVPYDTNTKMNPPLRSRDHIEAILEGLRDGTVDAIASDHAPHHADEKGTRIRSGAIRDYRPGNFRRFSDGWSGETGRGFARASG